MPDSRAQSAKKPVNTKKGYKYYDECRRYSISPFRHLPGKCSQKLYRIRFRDRFLRSDHRYRCTGGGGGRAGGRGAGRQAKVSGENPDTIWDFAIYAVIFSVIGARIYYVIFAWDYYKDNLLSIFNTRNGGMAIYGGVIGAFLTLFLYCKIKKINPFRLGDLCVPGLILGQAIGRWGNFMNREVFGEYTDNFLAMRLPIEAVRSRDISENVAAHIVEGTNYIQVHPTFLYESLWNLMILLIMLVYRKHKKFEGEICLLYFGGYGLGRFWIEGIRTDTLFIPGTTLAVSQVLSLCMVIFAVVTDIVVRMHLKKQPKVEKN